MTEKKTWYCRTCGSTDIRHDAIVAWDADAEDWRVVTALDDTWCEECSERSYPFPDKGEPAFGIPGQSDDVTGEVACDGVWSPATAGDGGTMHCPKCGQDPHDQEE